MDEFIEFKGVSKRFGSVRAVENVSFPVKRGDETIFLPEAVQARSEAIRDLGPHNALYIQAWDAIKAASTR